MIYDLFCFFNELDVLEERLTYLDNFIDRFVICESNITHTGLSKPFNFEDNLDKFADFKHKIIYLKYFGLKNENPYVTENLQRNFMLSQINPNQFDKIIISDIDEIPSINFMEKLLNYNGNEILISIQELSYFWPNYRRSDIPYWAGGSRGFNYSSLSKLKNLFENYSSTFIKEHNEEVTLTKIRLTNIGVPINNGGWHLSYMGGTNSIKQKIKAFTHTELDEKIGYDIDTHIKKFLAHEKNFFGDNEKYFLRGSFKNNKLKIKEYSKNMFSLNMKFKWNLIKSILILKILFKLYVRKLLLWKN